MKGVAQINVRMEYNQEDKTLFLYLKNETNKIFMLQPIENSGFDGYESSITFLYRDKSGNLLDKRKRLINDYQHRYYRSMGNARVLEPYAENKYIHGLVQYNKDDKIHTVDIIVKIDAEIIGEKVGSKVVDATGSYKTELRKQVLWE